MSNVIVNLFYAFCATALILGFGLASDNPLIQAFVKDYAELIFIISIVTVWLIRRAWANRKIKKDV